MATIKAILRTKKEIGNLRFRVSDGRDIQLWWTSDIEVKASLWDASKEQIKTRAICSDKERADIDSRVGKEKAMLKAVYTRNKDCIKTSEDLAKLMYLEKRPELKQSEKSKEDTFFGAFNAFMKDFQRGAKAEGNYRTLERTLHRYEGYLNSTTKGGFRLDYNTITADDIEDFFDYCNNEHDLAKEDENLFACLMSDYSLIGDTKRNTLYIDTRSKNTLISMQRRYKRFWNWLLQKKKTTNNPFEEITIGAQVYGDPYYITPAERDIIAECDLSEWSGLEEQRDIFIFQCLIGCRVGDLMKLTGKNIVGDEVQYIPSKTSYKDPIRLKVPLHPKAMALVEKYGNKGTDKPLFPFTWLARYNWSIRKILTLAGITRPVEVIDPKTGKKVSRPINELASSHMARRTFIGALYQKTPDPNIIGKLSGHAENSKAFARYRDIDDDMKRDLISKL